MKPLFMENRPRPILSLPQDLAEFRQLTGGGPEPVARQPRDGIVLDLGPP